jgi:hypothetical protein
MLDILRKTPGVDSVFMFGEYLHVTFKEETTKILIAGMEEIEPAIEDCFIALMNKNEHCY